MPFCASPAETDLGAGARLSCRLPRGHSLATHRFAASPQQRFKGQKLSGREGGGNEPCQLDLGKREVSGYKGSSPQRESRAQGPI